MRQNLRHRNAAAAAQLKDCGAGVHPSGFEVSREDILRHLARQIDCICGAQTLEVISAIHADRAMNDPFAIVDALLVGGEDLE